MEGRCSAVQLSPAQGEAIDVVYLDGQLLWSTGSEGDLLTILADGSTLPAIVAQDESFVADLGSDGQRVYWVEYDGTQVDPAQPGSERLVADTTSYYGRWGRLVVDGDDVWWATAATLQMGPGGMSLRASF